MSRRTPIAVLGAIVASVVALAVLWVSPAVGLVLAGAVIVAGLVLLATGRPAVGVVVALTPFAVFLLASQVVDRSGSSPTGSRARRWSRRSRSGTASSPTATTTRRTWGMS